MSDNLQELLCTFEKLLIENAKNNIYLEMVTEISENNESNIETTSKIHDVLMYHNLSNCTLLQDDCVNSVTFNMLDLKENSSQLLTYKDTNYIKECLKEKIKDKHTSVFKEINKFTEKGLIDISLLMTSVPKLMKIEPILLQQVTEIYKEQNEYGLLMKKLGKTLEDLLNIRLNTFVTTCSAKSENLEMNIKLLKVKMQYSMLVLKKSIFMDTKDTLSAYKIIIDGLNEKKNELIVTIQKHEHVLNILTNMSYNPEMLRLYNQYCDLKKAIEFKKYFHSN